MSLESTIRAAATKYGVDGDVLLRIAQLESNMQPNARNGGSGASGLFQFVRRTARAYGLADPSNPAAAADAAARLLRDNSRMLTRGLKRAPTPAELYLAHQQGATGAVKLLQNADKPAVDVVGLNAVLDNGGSADMSAKQFAQRWLAKFGRPQSLDEDEPVTKTVRDHIDTLDDPEVEHTKWTIEDIYRRLMAEDPERLQKL